MIYYKFKSMKDPSRIMFDGPLISVFHIKREIILANKLGNGTQFDLAIYNEQAMEEALDNQVDPVEYTDDTEMIRRATSIIAVRRPPSQPGKGNAKKYVSDLNLPSWRQRGEFPEKSEVTPTRYSAPTTAIPGIRAFGDEDAMMSKMLADQIADWEATQERMARVVTPVNFNRPKRTPAPVPNKPPPSGYVCHRCDIPGHWIQACPTISDPNASSSRHKWDCEICGKWSKNATRTSCCKKLYCHRCIEHALVVSDFVCPGCEAKEILLESLVADENIKREISERWTRKDSRRNSSSPKLAEMENASNLGKRKRSNAPQSGSESEPSTKRSRPHNLTDLSSNKSAASPCRAASSPTTSARDNRNGPQPNQLQLNNCLPPFALPMMPFLPVPAPFMMAAMDIHPMPTMMGYI